MAAENPYQAPVSDLPGRAAEAAALEDRALAQRLLAYRELGGPSYALFLRGSGWHYGALFALYATLMTVSAAADFPGCAGLFLGLLIGSLLRDIGWVGKSRRQWPFQVRMLKWDEVTRAAGP